MCGENPFSIVKNFEEIVRKFTGAKYAVAVDSGTSALFLSLKYRFDNGYNTVEIPKKTFYGLPIISKHIGYDITFTDNLWTYYYKLNPISVIDSALCLTRDMYIGSTFMCLSFNYNKPLQIGRGGMILHDNAEADVWFRKARFFGRNEKRVENDQSEFLGWKMYMTPDEAAKGLMMMHRFNGKTVKCYYPDLSEWEIFS